MNEPEQKRQDDKQHLFDNPRNVSRLLNVFYAFCALLFILDFIVHRHITHSWEDITGFFALFGFIAYVIMVMAAKLLRKTMMRKEDYYDVDE